MFFNYGYQTFNNLPLENNSLPSSDRSDSLEITSTEVNFMRQKFRVNSTQWKFPKTLNEKFSLVFLSKSKFFSTSGEFTLNFVS